MTRCSGRVKWFDDTKGFGFIRPDDGSKDVFVHRSAIAGAGSGRRTLQDGQAVQYNVIEGRRGLEASNVTAGG